MGFKDLILSIDGQASGEAFGKMAAQGFREENRTGRNWNLFTARIGCSCQGDFESIPIESPFELSFRIIALKAE